MIGGMSSVDGYWLRTSEGVMPHRIHEWDPAVNHPDMEILIRDPLADFSYQLTTPYLSAYPV
jgi:hypothetical protein